MATVEAVPEAVEPPARCSPLGVNAELAALEQRVRDLDAFSRQVAHELQTPLGQQPLGLRTLVAGKLALRALAVLLTMSVVLAAVMLATRPALRSVEGLPDIGAATGLVACYGLFWLALAAAVNALGRSSAFNALALVASWVLLVLVLPVALNLAVTLASPAPSRIELAARTRLAAIQGLNRYQAMLGADYRYVAEPQALLPKDGKFEVASRRRAQYLVGRDTDREIEALVDHFDQQLAGQQALVDRWSWLSPAIVANEALTSLAGTGSPRYLRLRQQVAQYHAQWKAFFEPRLLQGLAMTEADLRALPRFAWREPPRALLWSDVGRGVLQLGLPALLLAVWTRRRLSHYQVA